ncbi:MAG: hypothetical protein LBH21_07780 [Gracilibacteraceae bacterium]|jgi:hypothetical protein|nr:hypothetical protein [Gracilibacteraceae bacterium]
MKKIITILTVTALAATLAAAPVFAHGHNAGAKTANYTNYTNYTNYANYAICDVENCGETGLHMHGSAYYRAHGVNDGHDYHGYCAVSGCTLAGYHEHGGTYCFGHTTGCGHGYDRAREKRTHH